MGLKSYSFHFSSLSLRALRGTAIHALRFFSLSLRGGSRRGRRGNPDRIVVGAALWFRWIAA
jgi:hypothetical protein